MFSFPDSAATDVQLLEQKLRQQRDELQRLILLDQLIDQYSYTNVKRAREYLEEQKQLLLKHNLPDFELNYFLHLAAVANQQYDFEQASEAFQRALNILEERGTINQLAEASIDYAGTCINQQHMEEAIDYLERADKLLRNFPDQRLEARLICRNGFTQLHYGDYGSAIELLLDARRRFRELNSPLGLKDYYFMTLIHSGLGRIYSRNDEHQKSVMAFREVVAVCERLDMRSRLSWHYLNVGSSYLSLFDFQNAEHYFQRAINAEDDASQQSRAGAYANLGICYIEQERYEEALELFDRAESLYREQNQHDYGNFSIIAYHRGRLYWETDDPQIALKHLQQALEYAQAGGDLRHLAMIAQDMASIHAENEQFEDAYRFQQLHDRNFRLHQERLDRQRRHELEIQYEAKQKRQEAERLQLLAAQLQLKALRAQMNPHFMYNALNAIQSYISGNDPSAASRYLAKFAKLMRQSLDYSEMEFISLEKEIEFLEDYLFINAKLRFDDKLIYDIQVDDEIEEDILGVPTMIIQPYVENAIEHGLRSKTDGRIQVHFSLIDEDTILCVVEDNGIGRERAQSLRQQDPGRQEHRSRGTQITEKRLSILNRSRPARFPVRTIDLLDAAGKGCGTRVEIHIPAVDIQMS